MKSLPKPRFERLRMMKQRGLVLFFALIALVALSLAAVALIRSVDTSTLIAGNLAFKQAATTAGDAGVEAAMGWLAATQAANSTKNVTTDITHDFNITDNTSGYYSYTSAALDLFANAPWDAIDTTKIPVITDNGGNNIQYIIQRMCRNGNPTGQPGIAIQNAGCLFSGAFVSKDGQQVKLPQQVCNFTVNPGCPLAGQSPQIRITARIKGPRNTRSYVQAIVY